MTVETHIAHFVVTGEAMTEMARDLLLSDEPGKAYRLIADNLIGEGAIEAALGVMRGTHDLVGDSLNGLSLAAAEDTEHLRRFKRDYTFIYAGRFRSGRGWRRPVAQIVRFGPRDAKHASERTSPGLKGTAAMRRWSKERAAYYCGPGETVELLKLNGEDTYIIWETCPEAPHWVKPPASLQEALDESIAAGRRLEERPSAIERELEDQEAQEQSRARAREGRAEREARQAQREREYDELVASIGPKVREQAGDDTFSLEMTTGRVLKVPRAPFIRWALSRTSHADSAPEWENVAPIGLKMAMDNPDHTDWVLGAGLDLSEAYNDEVMGPALDASFQFQEDARNDGLSYPGIRAAMELLTNTIHSATILVDSGERIGTVGEDIAVFPDSAGERAKQLDGIIGAIVEKGGQLAHFAIVSKGRGVTVMRHPEAVSTFPAGTRVQLNPATGRIVILEDDE